MTQLSSETKAALLLTSWFTREGGRPLSRKEFNEVEKWVRSGPGWDNVLMGELGGVTLDPDRIKSLLSRGFALAESLDRWIAAGIWIASRRDPRYPGFFKRLKENAPPVVFGVGHEPSGSRISVVGSRDAPDKALEAAQALGANCARDGIVVVSGGARGVDLTATTSCLEAGGSVIEILAHDLLKTVLGGATRKAIKDGRAFYLSEVSPEARFQTAQVMDRNRLLIAAGDALAVMDVRKDKGGTRQGVIDALRMRLNEVYIFGGEGADAFQKKGCKNLSQHQLSSPRSMFEASDESLKTSSLEPPGFYDSFVTWLSSTCSVPKSTDELRRMIPDLTSNQWDAWLNRACSEHKILLDGSVVQTTEPQRRLF